MTDDEYQRVINELQRLIDDTQNTLSRFEASGMDKHMQGDYDKLLSVLHNAVKQQREYTKAMLSG